MPVRGDHLEPVRTSTRDFAKYNTVFKKKLVALYKIVVKRVDNANILSNTWCGNTRCATQGILSYGHLLSMCPDRGIGYYISPRLKVPKKFANNKSIGRDFYPIFVCKARNLKCSKEDILFVQTLAKVLQSVTHATQCPMKIVVKPMIDGE
ncbi:hypothetical protein B0O80DRAFT_501116 [Mortierella sp. GBAus27b]|nr:hypothetical protein B0O80DRAFT_501116 [Mortierella sp. GBAus27b]